MTASAKEEGREGISFWETIWLSLVMLLPVWINRVAMFAYAMDRRLLLHGAGVLALVAVLAGRKRWRELISGGFSWMRWVCVWGALLLVIRGVSGVCGLDPEQSILGSPVRDGGWLSNVSCALLALAMWLQGRRRIQAERLWVAVCVGAIVPCVVGVLQCCGVPILVGENGFPEGRIWSTFGNAILFGSYLVGVIPVTVWLAVRAFWARRRVGAVALSVGVCVEGFLLWKTGSRGPLLGLLVAGAVSGLLVLRACGARLVSRALSWAMVAGVLLVLGGVHLVAYSGALRSQMEQGRGTRFNTVEMRLLCTEAMTQELMATRPWLGYGQDVLSAPIQRRLPVRYELVEGKDHVPDSTHSATVDALGGSGVLGVMVLAGFVGAMVCVATPWARRRWGVVVLSGGGAAAMMALWGVHMWALGAVAGCILGMLLLAGHCAVEGAPELDGLGISAVAMAVGLWVESQFSVYSVQSAVLLTMALAVLVLASRGWKWESAEGVGASPWGWWCVGGVIVAVVGFVALCALTPHFGNVEVGRIALDFARWLDTLVHHSGWVHVGVYAAMIWVIVLLGKGRGAWMRRLGFAGVCTAAVMALMAFTEWRVVERDMRVACAKRVAEGGRPDVAVGLVPGEIFRGRGAYATHYALEVRPVLQAWAKGAKAEARAWERALALGLQCARVRAYDAGAHLELAGLCVAALEAHDASWSLRANVLAHAERAYREALACVPGSNVTRQRLAKLLYVYGQDRVATEAVFEEMLGLEPENPVVLSMRAQFALLDVKGQEGDARVESIRAAYVNAERALRSPSLSMNGVDISQLKTMRELAKKALVELGVTVPVVPRAVSAVSRLQVPVFEEASERHLGQALLGAVIALVISFVLVGPVRWVARRLGWVDVPAARKVHGEPTPLLGGLAIIAGVWVVALCVPAVPFHGLFLAVLGVATGLAIVGVVDDRWPLPWQIKIAAQLGAAVCLYALGVRVQLAWLPAWINFVLTVLWLVGVTNAVNFLDNMNGLSNGLAAWSSAAVSAIALVCGEWDVAAFALALTGACAGFLRGNNPWRGSIFMGDTGSLFLGFTLASLALLLRFPNNENWVTWLCPVLLLAVPVFDMTHVCLARLRRGCNPFSTPGKDHTSHLFERMGLSRPMAVLAVHSLVILCAVATWVVSFSRPIVAYAVAGCVLAGAVFLLGYFELRFGIGGVDEYRAPQAAGEARAGFTLLEVLAVIAILSVLASISTPMIQSAQRQARQTDCRSNLRQFGIALANYRSEHNGLNPAWMSNLFPDYVDGKDIYVCKSDKEIRQGTSGYDPIPKSLTSVTHYSEIRDFGTGSQDGRNNDIDWNSYFYEFAGTKCSWDSNAEHDMDGDGQVDWWEAKEWQLRYGDKKNDGGGSPENPRPYSTARMPIIRCWHHWQEDKCRGFEVDDYDHSGRTRNFPMVLNVGYAGNVFASPPWWEGRPDVGE